MKHVYFGYSIRLIRPHLYSNTSKRSLNLFMTFESASILLYSCWTLFVNMCILGDMISPAARIGEINLPPKDYIVKINVDHQTSGDYTLIEPRWDYNGNAVYSSSDAYNKGVPLKLTICEAVHEELPNDYIEKIWNYFNGWDTFKDYFSCDGLVAIETNSHIELIDCVNMTVTFRVLTKFTDLPNWNYVALNYSKVPFPNPVISCRYNGNGGKFTLSSAYQAPLTRMRLFVGINKTFGTDQAITASSTPKNVEWASMFCRYTSDGEVQHGLTSISFDHMDAYNVTCMRDLCYLCSEVTTIEFPDNFDTSNVINMRGMFNSCISLSTLNISSFDTSKVENMQSMFADCISLPEIDVRSFDTTGVTNMKYMFRRMMPFQCGKDRVVRTTVLMSSKFIASESITASSSMFTCGEFTNSDSSAFALESTHNGFDKIQISKSLMNHCITKVDVNNIDPYLFYDANEWVLGLCGCIITKDNSLNMEHWPDDTVYVITPPPQ